MFTIFSLMTQWCRPTIPLKKCKTYELICFLGEIFFVQHSNINYRQCLQYGDDAQVDEDDFENRIKQLRLRIMKLMHPNGEVEYPARSCKDLFKDYPILPDGTYISVYILLSLVSKTLK